MHDVDLTDEVRAFLRDRAQLKAKYGSQWVVYFGQECRGAWQDFADAATFAMSNFPGKPFLIQDIDARDECVPLVFAGAE